MFPNSSDQSHPVDETWASDPTEMRKHVRLLTQISKQEAINFINTNNFLEQSFLETNISSASQQIPIL
jgi:hypothetical protein